MRCLIYVAMVLAVSAAPCQQIEPGGRTVIHFQVAGVSRLAALAKVGALTNTTLLIEAADLAALQTPVVETADNTTLATVVHEILRGLDSYEVRNEGALLIVSTSGQTKRMLTLPLGLFAFQESSISSLYLRLGYIIRRATGCNPKGWGGSGPTMDARIPPFQLTHATVEKIVAKVADAPEASMWVAGPDASSDGCIDAPFANWQIGLYGFGRRSTPCDAVFVESVGPQLVGYLMGDRRAASSCEEVQIPNFVPAPQIPNH